MKASFFFLLLVAAWACTVAARFTGDTIDGRYIVVFKSNITAQQARTHMTVFEKYRAEVRDTESAVLETYEIGTSFKGFYASLSKSLYEKERSHPDVAFVEPDRIVTIADCGQQNSPPSWGLPRVSEVSLNLVSPPYRYEAQAGADVDVYIIDTGIQVDHVDFEGRAVWGTNAAGDGQDRDCNGHGTHVAGTVAGHKYGIAKLANLIAVKVLDCGGSGSTSGVISGIKWATTQHQSKKGTSVANMSLGGGASAALDSAVEASIDAGITYAIAAGNSQADACNFSPARAPKAITVGATAIVDDKGTQSDARVYFSNYGPCVDVLAPGSMITSAWIGSTTAENTISGTSMASPHVAGVAALILGGDRSLSPAKVSEIISSTATPNIIDMACAGSSSCAKTPNLLLHKSCSE